MTRHPRPGLPPAMGGLAALLLVGMLEGPATGQLAPRPSFGPAPAARPAPAALMQAALASNPLVAPYPIELFERDGRVVLRGAVGTKLIYDAAIRTAIASGIPFADELVIDTLAAREVAFRAALDAQAGMAAAEPPLTFPTYGAVGGFPPPTYLQFSPVPGGPPALIYPPPLFGVLDEPFLGFEPPVISYPPDWWARSASRLGEFNASRAAAGAVAAPGALSLPGAPPIAGDSAPPPGTIDAQITPDGVVTLRGTVATMAERIALGQYLAQTPGVSQVINLLNVDPSAAGAPTPPAPPAGADPPEPRPVAPRPPEPGGVFEPRPPADRPPEAGPPPADVEPADPPLDALPELAGLPIRVSLRDGTATLDGEAPTALEAMAAHLAVKRHPGVVAVIDRLRVPVPIEPRSNPLRSAPDPRDVEEYLGDQIRRHLGDLAEVDRVRLAGDRLDIQGRLRDADDLRRAEATVRSIPVLRGFALAIALETPP